MYKLKIYFDDTSVKFSDFKADTLEELYDIVIGMTDDFDEFLIKKYSSKTSNSVLEIAWAIFSDFYDDYYLIELVKNDIVIDSLSKRTKKELDLYKVKIYHNDGSICYSSGVGYNPISLVNDLDGLMPWEEFDEIKEDTLNTKEVLKLLFKYYKNYYKDYHRIEIINIKTNEIIDFIEI